MLLPAILYKEQLTNLFFTTWFSEKYQYFWCGDYSSIQIEDNTMFKEQYVYIENDKIVGYFSFSKNNTSHTLTDFGLINFGKANISFIKEVLNLLKERLDSGVCRKISFFAYADNPAVKGYEKLIKRFGGRLVGTMLQETLLLDHKYHDLNIYECFARSDNK